MIIRKAITEDIDSLLAIYSIARKFMQDTGNGNHWINGYPARELIENSIKQGKQYVCSCENEIAGTFYFCIEDDETYKRIYEGEWLNSESYGVVHRLASSQKHKGVARFCLQWCFEQCKNIRVDTHRKNIISKLNARNITDAVRMALQKGMI